MIKYPIIIFSYNRPNHLNKLLGSLERNKEISNHKIYFFCDGPKNNIDIKKISSIKNIIKLSKLKFFEINFREANLGLSENIIKGISKVLSKNDACMVFEGDLLVEDSTIDFINFFLNYESNKFKFGSVSAFSYIENFKTKEDFDYYISYRHCSWGWGTWSKIWNKIDWDNIDYKKHFENKNNLSNFSRGGRDLNLLLWGQYKNLINSWAIRFNLYCSSNNLLSLHPRYSLVENCGKDNSGTHEKLHVFKKQNKNKNIKDFNFQKENFKEEKILQSKVIDEYIQYSHRKSIKLLIYFNFFKLISFFFKKNY